MEEYLSAFCQVLIGLRHLHKNAVVHRDLKPENLLVEAPFVVIIADFGLSKVATDGLLKTVCGTPLYAAPEIFPGNIEGYGPSVDIWSTGVIFLTLIYGAPAEPDIRNVRPEKRDKYWSKCWSEALVARVKDLADNDLLAAILTHMVRIDPKERLSVEQCLEMGCKINLFRRRRDGYIVVADENPGVDNLIDASENKRNTPTQKSHSRL